VARNRRRRAAAGIVVAGALLLGACGGGGSSSTVVRSAEDVQVLTPKQVKQYKARAAKGQSVGTATGASGAVPQNVDNRPVEQRLFEAYANFSSCLTASGDKVRGNLLDRSNPAFKDPEYVSILSKCASRTGILQILNEFQSVRTKLTPKQVKERNKGFLKLKPCLEKRGWKIETSTNEIGLISPTQFVSPDGSINSRDLSQCSAQNGLFSNN
jgi:hypothetical protein